MADLDPSGHPDDLDRLVRRAVASPVGQPPALDHIRRRAAGRRHRHRALALTTLVVPIAVLAALWTVRDRADGPQRVTSDPTDQVEPPTVGGPREPPTVAEPVRSVDLATDVSPMAPSPLSPREAPVAVWTGEELLVWGGASGDKVDGGPLGDGAAYDPSTDTWRPMAEAPIDARSRAAAVWTGTEMIVWGGTGRVHGVGGLLDGAAYDPVSDTWRRIAPAPDGVPDEPTGPATRNDRTDGQAVWAAGRVVIGGGTTSSGDATSILAYDPASDSWSAVNGTAPVATLVAAGDRVAVLTVTDRAGAGEATVGLRWFDPVTTRFEHGPDFPVAGQDDERPRWIGRVGAAWTGDELVVTASSGEGRYEGAVATTAPGADGWYERRATGEDGPLPWAVDLSSGRVPGLVEWTGTHVVAWELGTLTRYDPATGEVAVTAFRVGSGVTCAQSGAQVWTGREVLVWGGHTCRGGSPLQVATGHRISPDG